MVRHCFSVLFIGFTASESIAGFVVLPICFKWVSKHSWNGENCIMSIQISGASWIDGEYHGKSFSEESAIFENEVLKRDTTMKSSS
jgi:hypothetical protein